MARSNLQTVRGNDPLLISRVIGDVLDSFRRSHPLKVLYNGREVTNGCELRTPAVSRNPRVDIGSDTSDSLFVLIMVDPDSPSPSNPTSREYLLWLVANIPGGSDANFGDEIVKYEGPRPAVGIHRVVFVLLRQRCRLVVDKPGWREQFSTRDFAEFYGLGLPVAAVYFNCQRENGSGGRRFQ